ncbi:SDR family oxidoreductase [uncultured Mucilaginibacter sp.]|uniref:SDR family NAD(P)-dependent oxidoreductase n=1 Tax=uncultured Mucilaginibacter sp. TaxID=797541 RepID=UPI0025F24B55|nr:SDR family oxidoreductase [uncultured Mucilaginibacter sp.]
MFSLQGKHAVITGGGSGIGRAITKLFAERGAVVNILDADIRAAESLAEELRNDNMAAAAYDVNVTVQEQVEAALRSIGRVDILVNNAGIAHVGNVEKTQEADFERIFNVNVQGAYNCFYAAVPIMKAQGGGIIVSMASIASWVGIADRFAYSMSKGAIHAMSMSVARDYLEYNIRSNTISPARVHTPFVDGFIANNYAGKEAEMYEKLSKSQPIGRMARPEEVAALALYLCSDEASFISGCDYPIDGGFIKLNN